MTNPTDPSDVPEPEASLGEAAAHVQDAVLSIVAAARSALDAIERFTRDPSPFLEAASRAADVGRDAASSWAGPGPTPADRRQTDAAVDDSTDVASAAAEPSGPSRRPRVEHVRVEPADG
jgi:hypothetical protein